MTYVLIIENESALSEIISLYCNCKSIENRIASSYEDVIHCVKENGEPSLILLDYFLYDDEPAVKITKLFNPEKVVLMTAVSNPEKFLKLLGLHRVLKKPFGLDDLDAILNNQM